MKSSMQAINHFNDQREPSTVKLVVFGTLGMLVIWAGFYALLSI